VCQAELRTPVQARHVFVQPIFFQIEASLRADEWSPRNVGVNVNGVHMEVGVDGCRVRMNVGVVAAYAWKLGRRKVRQAMGQGTSPNDN
jgi:hypothetical protein